MTASDPFVIHSLLAYANRIGADQINFRKYMVKIYTGNYYTERALIEIDADGEVKVTDEEYAPSEEEREAIRNEIEALAESFPTSIRASDDDLARLVPTLRSELYETFRDVDDGDLIIMVQERVEKDDGGKYFLPHTLFSDNIWRQMEPDGKLPFWRPSLRPEEKRSRIMVHEGAKAARAANRIVKEREPHPWLAELVLYEHWGAIGGAQAPHRLDYAVLRRRNPMEVVYVCDHDLVGESALPKVSRSYGKKMKGIVFNELWPDAWDVADPIPRKFYRESDGRYIGPTLNKLITPATWAISFGPPKTPKGKPTIEVTADFLDEWVHSVVPNTYVHKSFPNRILTAAAFDDLTRPFTGLGGNVRLSSFMEAYFHIKVIGLAYEANLPAGKYHFNGELKYNTHVPGNVEKENIDPAPFLEYMKYMITEERDRNEMLRWIATLVARSDVRMRYGVLLISNQQGIGKSTLGEAILAPLVGEDNFSSPSETAIVESQFNEWAAHKRLVLCHEIYSSRSWRAYNKLKTYVTDRIILVNKKNQPTYNCSNWVHIILCSNRESALRMDFNDRRWLVPKLTDRLMPKSWWTWFHEWLVEEGGLGAIRKWAEDFLAKNEPVSTADHAPMTAAKEEAIIDGLSDDEVQCNTLLEALEKEYGEAAAVLDTAVVVALRLLNNNPSSGDPRETKFRPMDVRGAAKSFPDTWYITGRITFKGWPHCTGKSRLLVRKRELLALSNEELKKAIKPIDVASEVFRLMGAGIYGREPQ